MLFNSIEFAIFLPVVFVIYWYAFKRIKMQNLFLLAASYFFYGWWDVRFLSLIAFSSFVDYFVGIGLSRTDVPRKRKMLVAVSVLVNLGFLGVFKYYNFFAESFAEAFSFFGVTMDPGRLNVVLPVGISFYTFQTMSYTLDVAKRRLEPTRDIISFFAFVSFFPQLVAGPIERAVNLLPQFEKQRTFDLSRATDGMRQILWGLFKKMVIADNCAVIVNNVFPNYQDYPASTLLVAVIFFAFQIYGDFSGYSDIAIGTARLFGFDLMRNFAYPYFSRDIAEFWRRWHISLSSWFRDYVYIPLGGSRGTLWNSIRNTFVVFVVSGFWHGANWTFIIWGALNAIYFLPLMLLKRNRRYLEIVAEGRKFPSFRELLQMLSTFALVTLAWVFFRAENLNHALGYLRGIFSRSILQVPHIVSKTNWVLVLFLIIVMVAAEWIGRENQHALEFVHSRKSRLSRWAIYVVVVFAILSLGGTQQAFIYFQF